MIETPRRLSARLQLSHRAAAGNRIEAPGKNASLRLTRHNTTPSSRRRAYLSNAADHRRPDAEHLDCARCPEVLGLHLTIERAVYMSIARLAPFVARMRSSLIVRPRGAILVSAATVASPLRRGSASGPAEKPCAATSISRRSPCGAFTSVLSAHRPPGNRSATRRPLASANAWIFVLRRPRVRTH